MSVSNWFETFNQNLRMSASTVADITYRYKRITKQLNKDFYNSDSETSHSFYAGSYGRGTDILVSDIDTVFQLPYSEYSKHLSQLRSTGAIELIKLSPIPITPSKRP